VSTASLLLIVGSVVCVKTLAFVGFMARRARRQRGALAAAASAVARAEAAAHQGQDPDGWRLQWAEPGVLLVENTSDVEAARDVGLSATLTAGSGVAASVEQSERFVGSGACFTARFAWVDPWLAVCMLSYTLVWQTSDGERRRETRTAHPVLPVPDLSRWVA
jgi:hypothetical protein